MRTSLSRLRAVMCAAVALAGSVTAQAQLIRVKGSDALGAKLVPLLSEAYKKVALKDLKFEIAAEGSSTAFSALVNDLADLGMSSRKPTAQELALANAKGIKLVEVVACRDMMAVVIHKDNKVKNLTKDQVQKIFTGAVKDWSEVGGDPGAIAVFTRNTASGTHKDWQKMAMDGRAYAETSRKLSGSDSPAMEVAANKNGISYVGLAYAKASGIHAVSIDGIEPVAEKVKEYAYSRVCYYYLKEGGSAAAKEFVDFATGEEGRNIVKSVGFVPN